MKESSQTPSNNNCNLTTSSTTDDPLFLLRRQIVCWALVESLQFIISVCIKTWQRTGVVKQIVVTIKASSSSRDAKRHADVTRCIFIGNISHLIAKALRLYLSAFVLLVHQPCRITDGSKKACRLHRSTTCFWQKLIWGDIYLVLEGRNALSHRSW